ncbi:MAG: hypothetical protein DCC75_10845 [Proteobacteria bacterium]|nr:MAG: hypothetical protein DCC75_10845 [Pseudomonadota bacterium]
MKSLALVEIEQEARNLAANTNWGESIGLIGPLGAGKTTFIRYFCAAKGCALPVSSPSYVIQHEYECGFGKTIEHWDLYRLHGIPDELRLAAPSNAIRLIEWVDKFPELVAECGTIIKLGIVDSEHRSLEIGTALGGSPF